ncbi:FAD-dependent oxidoreductase [Simplicispira psychrophila]|uniref:FAD-dependent oxidoreductase n=1 Tax=Simplicispira psychrophila TaxID=80882 RepID=UPI00048271DE|nr:FAD-dependent oxidoreductase [Simplicispira psychrophila]
MKRLVLVGGGHAHLSVLTALAVRRPANVEITLITPSPQQNYSGMLPGWISGHYKLSACQIDLQPLVNAARGQLILESVVGMDATRHCVCLGDGRHVHYDWLSMDVGTETETSWLETLGTKLLPVKPLDLFFTRWPEQLTAAQKRGSLHLAVVGAGAAGVEIALAAQFALQRAGVQVQVDLIASESGVLKGHHRRVQERLLAYAGRAGMTIHFQRAVGTPEGVLLADGQPIAADLVIAATGARAPVWLQLSKLALDTDGYILVDKYHRSVSHPNVFAAGDVCARPNTGLSRSGVHAVHAGPVLADNLLAVLQSAPLRAYLPRPHSLYLLACGPRYAIASWGPWSAEGAWVWHWKDWIDRRFVRRFTAYKVD